MNLSQLPAVGQPLEGGIFVGLTTDKAGQHHAVTLLADKPDVRLPWQHAKEWAQGLGNGATLPTRPVAALLFANAKDQFEEAWHWTCETDVDDGSYAWNQYFLYGFQGNSHKSFEGRARAVRLIQLTA